MAEPESKKKIEDNRIQTWVYITKKIIYEDKHGEVHSFKKGEIIPASAVMLAQIDFPKLLGEGTIYWCNSDGNKIISTTDMIKPEDDVDKLMKEKGIDRETAWKIIQDRKEAARCAEAWSKQDKKNPADSLPKPCQNPAIEKAIWFYYDQGFSVIPVGVNKENDLKKPSIIWQQYHDVRPTKEEIQQWIDDGLFIGIAVICGAVSKNLAIIDIDDATIPEDIGFNLSDVWNTGGWVTKTGKGYHIWMQHHGNPGGIRKPSRYHIEFRANDGYCVVPPSNHPNGSTYTFMDGYTIETLPELVPKDAKAIFNNMKDKIGLKRGITTVTRIYKPTTINIRDADTKEKPECVKIALQTKVKHPDRYYRKFGIVSSAVWREVPIEEARKELMEFDMNMCEPPEGKTIVNQAVDGAYQKDAHLYGCEYWMDDADLCPFENPMECPYGKKKRKRDLIKKYHVFDYAEQTNKDTGKKWLKIVKVHPPKLARMIINEFDLDLLTLRDTKEIFFRNDGIFHDTGETKVAELAEMFLEDQMTTHHVNEVIGYITHYNYQDRNIFKVPPNLINMENGIFNIETNTMERDILSYHFLNKIPVTYDPMATCPRILKFLSEILYPDDIPVFQEFAGYCLYRRYHIHRAIMFLGGGKNGKSTAIQLLRAFVGEDNTSNKELQQIVEDRFATSALYGKMVNSASDIGSETIYNSSKFKGLCSEDPIDAEVKFKSSYSLVSYAKLIFSANKLPKTTDESYAFFRRWLLISFPNTFEGANCNKDLLAEITTPEELSGFFNWAIEGLRRLLAKGDFSYSKSVEDVADEYKTLSDPIYAYVNEKLMCKTNEGLLKDDVYEDYNGWCKTKQLPINPKNTFTSELAKHLPELRAGKRGGKGNQKPSYENIAWKPTEGDKEKEEKQTEGEQEKKTGNSTLPMIVNPDTDFTGGN